MRRPSAPQPLPARKDPDREVDPGAAEEKAGEQVHPLGIWRRRRERCEVLGHGAVEVEQVQPLGQVGDSTLGASDLAAVWREITVEQP